MSCVIQAATQPKFAWKRQATQVLLQIRDEGRGMSHAPVAGATR